MAERTTEPRRVTDPKNGNHKGLFSNRSKGGHFGVTGKVMRDEPFAKTP